MLSLRTLADGCKHPAHSKDIDPRRSEIGAGIKPGPRDALNPAMRLDGDKDKHAEEHGRDDRKRDEIPYSTPINPRAPNRMSPYLTGDVAEVTGPTHRKPA